MLGIHGRVCLQPRRSFAGADGLVSKGVLGSELGDAVRGIARGRAWLATVPWPVAEVMRRRLGAEQQ